jgi:hypothetical protein
MNGIHDAVADSGVEGGQRVGRGESEDVSDVTEQNIIGITFLFPVSGLLRHVTDVAGRLSTRYASSNIMRVYVVVSILGYCTYGGIRGAPVLYKRSGLCRTIVGLPAACYLQSVTAAGLTNVPGTN